MRFKGILILLALYSLSVFGQGQGSSFGWDLTYETLLKRNNVAANELVWIWLKKSKSPVEGWLAELKHKPVASAVLIEYPAFHAAERTTILLFRTESESFYWEFVEGGRWGRNEEPIKLELYDRIFKDVSTWRQLPPKRADELPDQALPGYMGFLSYFNPKSSGQMLLTMDDFLVCPEKKCEPGKITIGRLMASLNPILIPEEVTNYKHKSEAEIERMTPEERVNEYIKEHEHLTNSGDDHDLVIQKYLRRDGPKTFPYLIKLMDSYNPRRLRDSSSFVATLIAVGIDENVVRLRGSAEGRQVIEAMKRLDERMKTEYKDGPGVELDLRRVKGTNFKDEAISDALRLTYRVTVSKQELVEFVNYLIKIAPDYPSWSDTEWRMNLRRKSDSGVYPAQGPVVKKPLPYYQQYVAFKRSKNNRSVKTKKD